MATLIEALTDTHRMPVVDAASVDAFLTPAAGECAHAVLFFAGDPAQRPESLDVAVVLPELVATFRGRLRAAVVARAAEDALKPRSHVQVLPSLVVVRDGAVLGVLPRILDWSDYTARLAVLLAPEAAPMAAPSAGPKVAFRHVSREATP